MMTGDAAYIKKINRSLIVSKIIEYGMNSRADLLKITSLNKSESSFFNHLLNIHTPNDN
ncbi:hypothetical protein J2S10_001161 [Neobacillus ginsengisoli]|uniref:Uncharacterized protein n=1 Tax=Neobacillus ginsengisoli TaxID=904295 RepID=A0ABT9XR39_9BACI|nr:hypothetical protein [Neobacillus ginsengisoli]